MLSYTPVTDLVRHTDRPENAEYLRSLRMGQRPLFHDNCARRNRRDRSPASRGIDPFQLRL